MPAQAAALAAIDDQAHVQSSVQLNTQGLKQYAKAFDQSGLEYIPSIANFIAVDLKRQAMPVYEKLLRKGVIVRPVASYNMPEHLRITIGTTGLIGGSLALALKKSGHVAQITGLGREAEQSLKNLQKAKGSL